MTLSIKEGAGEMKKHLAEIIIRGRVVIAELLYVSGRGDYTVYLYRGRTYSVLAMNTPIPVTQPPEN